MYKHSLWAVLALLIPVSAYAQAPTVSGCQVLPTNSVWNTRVDSLPVAANSNAYVQTIGSTSPLHPDFGSNPGNGFPLNLVSGSQPKVSVSFTYPSDPGPYPIPANPVIEGGSDRHIMVLDTTNCVEYELFSASQNGSGWSAGSGAIFNLGSNALRADGSTSADAAGLPILPGLIRYDEVAAGAIHHAIRFTVPQTDNTHIWPARHDASSVSGTAYPPMGQRFRLKQSFNISSFSPAVQVILTAMKQYGMIVADNGAPWFISGETDTRWNDDDLHTLTSIAGSNFEAVDESSLIVDPNSGQAGGSAASSTPTPSASPAPSSASASTASSASAGSLLTNQWVNLISKNSGKCLDLTGGPSATQPGTHLEQWGCWGGTNQKFQFVPVQGGYKVLIQNSGQSLDVAGGASATADGTAIQQYPYWGGSNEIWTAVPTGDGYFNIKPLSSGKCMDVSGISTSNGAQVWQWSCWGGDNQKWQVVAAQ